MKRIHFIAIGGAVMHQLAIALKNQGNIVTGSDDEINDPARSNLASAGILPDADGWFPDRITTDLDAVVLGMHAKAGNPELLKAKELGITVYSFPQYVYEFSKNKKRVVVAGSHGKTTITSMIMHILRYHNLDFDYLVGAKLEGFSQSVKLTDAPLIILEGDEYPASVEEKKPKIFFYHPHITIISGIAWDHINVFPTYDNYFNQFEQYLHNIEPGISVYYNNEEEEVRRLIGTSASHLNAVPYNIPSYRYEDGKTILQTPEGDKEVMVFGYHNLLNMQSAIAVCKELGISEQGCYDAIATFTGAAKRLEKILETKDIVAFRDFAHAPSKLKATLNAVREAYSNHTVIACFELHTYSSLSGNFLSQYAGSMNAADKAIVYYSHHAISLKGLPGLEKQIVADSFKRDDIMVFDEKQDLQNAVSALLKNVEKPVCLLLMSSGIFDGIDWNAVCSQQN